MKLSKKTKKRTKTKTKKPKNHLWDPENKLSDMCIYTHRTKLNIHPDMKV